MEFKKYHKIKILGDEENAGILDGTVYIEEKIDGACVRFMFKNGIIIFGSRNQQITSNDGEDTNVQKNFVRFVKHVRDRVNLLPKSMTKKMSSKLIFYGEAIIKHSMNYDFENMPPYLGFDIYDIEDERFLDFKSKTYIFKQLGFNCVPLVDIVDNPTKIDESIIPQSKYALCQAEGIVIKNYDKQLFAKIVTDKFKEMNKKAFGAPKKHAENDDELLVSIYCTNARIDKIIFKLIDEGHKLDMTMMSHLIRAVIADIWDEAYKDIIKSQWTINFKKTRVLVSHRCVTVLKDVILNNQLNEE